MPIDRRSFLDRIFAAAALSSLTGGDASAQTPTAPPPGTHDSIAFWNQLYESQRGGPPKLAAPEREVRFLYHGSKGLAYTSDIPKTSLLDHPGDVAVTINLGQFRPSRTDQNAFRQLQSSSLRVDCVQTRPMMNLFAPLAWASLASLFPDKQGKLPSLQTLGFQATNSNAPENKVTLPGGLGKMAVNISTVRKESMLYKILTEAQNIAGITAPFFAFPAISIPALKAITTIYSALEQHTAFLLNSPLTMAVATQQALLDETRTPQYLPLVTGDYVLVPQAHVDELGKSLDKIDLTQGYLVDKNAPSNQPPETRAANCVPDVTYVTLRIAVSPLTPGSAPPPAPAGSPPSSDNGGSTAPSKGAAKKKK
ncbi:MAG: hypothetical protein P4L56_27230 [Candidatus Sulfopaludibacter sp.]|nr:hypothetical protein [Candidatus Sulfopaludibacter sp.]